MLMKLQIIFIWSESNKTIKSNALMLQRTPPYVSVCYAYSSHHIQLMKRPQHFSGCFSLLIAYMTIEKCISLKGPILAIIQKWQNARQLKTRNPTPETQGNFKCVKE